MEIQIEKKDGATIVKLTGNLDGVTSTQAQETILPLVENNCCMALDLTKCSYISSAGLRVLLMIAKEFSAKGGQIGLAGVCDEVKDVMDMTGFINFFRLYKTVDEVIGASRKEK